jgi:acetyl esterase
MLGPQRNGWPSTPRNWAQIRIGWPSPVTPRAAIWPRWSASSHATPAGPRILFQLLWYPSTTFDTSLPSFTENANAPILDIDGCKGCTRWYIGDLDLSDMPATLAPAAAEDLTGLPPAYIAVAGHDPLRDDGMRYAELLSAAGVPVELHNAQTLVHGYAGYDGVVPAATEAVESAIRSLRRALNPG